MDAEPGQITRLLRDWKEGDSAALNQLMALLYDDLRDMARNCLYGASTPTLPSRALVHELYLKLSDGIEVNFQDRHHFVALAARMIRNITVDYIRAQASDKRGGALMRVDLPSDFGAEGKSVDLVVLDEALGRLQAMDPRRAELVELRFFGGLTMAETAEVMGTSVTTVKRDWTFAKTWLLAQVSGA